MLRSLVAWSGVVIVAAATLEDCPGYLAANVQQTADSLTADLSLAGTACNVYGADIKDLKLLVEYQGGEAPQDRFAAVFLRVDRLSTSRQNLRRNRTSVPDPTRASDSAIRSRQQCSRFGLEVHLHQCALFVRRTTF